MPVKAPAGAMATMVIRLAIARRLARSSWLALLSSVAL